MTRCGWELSSRLKDCGKRGLDVVFRMPHGNSFLEGLIFFLLFGASWFLVVHGGAKMSGWRSLSKLFPPKGRVRARGTRFSSLSLGGGLMPMHYASCTSIGVDGQGILLSVFFPFRAGHPPIEIPWDAVSGCVRERFLLTMSTTIHLKGVPWPIKIHGKAGRLVFAGWEASSANNAESCKDGKISTRRIRRSVLLFAGAGVVMACIGFFAPVMWPVLKHKKERDAVERIVEAVGNATEIRVVEHSDRSQQPEQIYSSVNLNAEQRAELRDAMDGFLVEWRFGLSSRACAFNPRHRIETVGVDGSKFVLEICFECNEMKPPGKFVCDLPWTDSLRKFFASLGMSPDGPWPRGEQ